MSRYAAIDIGSNSIRMMAAEVRSAADMRVLAAGPPGGAVGQDGLPEGKLARLKSIWHAITLERMVEQYKKLDIFSVRAVGTAALRDASNRDQFLARAAAIIGGRWKSFLD
jgi:exopolyphosphatase/guanosine-5'-triphosphate,3'-diphosphate pyrophosphatase